MPRKRQPKEDPIMAGRPKVLSFAEGLRQAREKISELLFSQNTLTIAINGSGPGVGKTYLAGQLSKDLITMNVPTGVCTTPSDLSTADAQVQAYRKMFDNQVQQAYILGAWRVPHGVSRFGTANLRESYDQLLESHASGFGLDLGKVDLWLAIYKKGLPFCPPPAWANKPYDPFEDFIIYNDKVSKA